MVLKEKMSVQENRSPFNQEHEIFYSLSKLIILYLYLVQNIMLLKMKMFTTFHIDKLNFS